MAGAAEDRLKLNVCIFGPHKAGKSTLLGRLLLKTGAMDSKRAADVEALCAAQGRKDLKFAWLTDRLPEERDAFRGTVAPHEWRASIEAPRRAQRVALSLTDTPGAAKHVKGMVAGMMCCRVGVLVLSASDDDYERCTAPASAASQDISLRDRLAAAYTLGVRDVVVCVNRMDHASAAFSQERFESIRSNAEALCRIVGLRCVASIPTSAWTGESVGTHAPGKRGAAAPRMAWHAGPSLIDALLQAKAPVKLPTPPALQYSLGKMKQQPADGPYALRLPVSRAHLSADGTLLTVVGKVASGTAVPGMAVEVLAPDAAHPDGFTLTALRVAAVEVFHTRVAAADVGDTAGLSLRIGADLADWACAVVGSRSGTVVVGGEGSGVRYCDYFEAQVQTLHVPGVLSPGYAPIVDVHTAHVQSALLDIIMCFDRRTSQILEAQPTCLRANTSALVRFRPAGPLCLEPHPVCPAMGRILVREGPKLVAVGIVRHVKKFGGSEVASQRAAEVQS